MSSEPTYAIPSVFFDTSRVPKQDRVDAWHSFNSGLFELKRHNVADNEFGARARSYRIGQTVIGHYAVTGNIVRRAENRHKVEREDLFVMRMHRSGYTKGIMNDAGFQMQSDRFTLFDFHQDLNAETENVDYVSVTLPYSAIGYDPTRHSGLMQLSMHSPVGRVLRSNLEMMLDLAPMATLEEAGAIADGLSGFLKGIIAKDLREESVFQRSGRAREVAVRRFIEENLRARNLDATAICEAIGVSRPVLYRMFAAEGGVGRAIVKFRLKRAFDDLACSEPKRGAIARIGRRWGFLDPAHFSRLFRTEFGFTPSEALGSGLVSQPSKDRPNQTASPKRPSQHLQLIDLYNIGSFPEVR